MQGKAIMIRVSTVILLSMAVLLAKNCLRVLRSKNEMISLRSRRMAMLTSQFQYVDNGDFRDLVGDFTSEIMSMRSREQFVASANVPVPPQPPHSPRPPRLTKRLTKSAPLSLSDTLLEPRIIGGNEAARDRYPYIVSLTHHGSHFCGGSLIAPDMVLTAAHCKGYATTVEIGRYDRTKTRKEVPYESFKVAYEVRHPLYNARAINNDFLLVKLKQPNMNVERTFATLNQDENIPFHDGNGWEGGEEVWVMGWGDTNPDPDVFESSDVLMEAKLRYVPNDVCREASGYVEHYGGVIDFNQMITKSMLCAKDVTDDTCQGDSGSPMIIRGLSNDGEDDLQIGITSWGIGCGSDLFPGVYARISSQYSWIRTMVCKHSRRAPESFMCNGEAPPPAPEPAMASEPAAE